MRQQVVVSTLVAVMLWGCAGPPLTLYTLTAQAGSSPQTPSPVPSMVIAVARVGIPDALDTEDILVLEGNTLHRSSSGRWASRLSLGITDLLTADLASSHPDALVSDQPQAASISYRLMVNISLLAVAESGSATLVADWTILPTNPSLPVRRNRTQIEVLGAAVTDKDVVLLVQHATDRLAQAIDLSRLDQPAR